MRLLVGIIWDLYRLRVIAYCSGLHAAGSTVPVLIHFLDTCSDMTESSTRLHDHPDVSLLFTRSICLRVLIGSRVKLKTHAIKLVSFKLPVFRNVPSFRHCFHIRYPDNKSMTANRTYTSSMHSKR